VAMVANTFGRPFYVAVESYKFARMYPLSQRDVFDLCGESPIDYSSPTDPSALTSQRPNIDFTPAEYITLLFTDLGVLTPAAVSDELITLYQ
jgi:translation initiation factor eIF-2B subunit alpha